MLHFFMHKNLYVHVDTYMNTLYIKYVGCTYTLANNTNIRLFKGVKLKWQNLQKMPLNC